MEIVTFKIKDLAIQIKTGTTPSTGETLNFEDANFNWFTPGDFSDSKLVLKDSNRKISEYAVKNSATIFSPKTILITCIGDIGNSGIIEKEASANQQITGVVVNSEIINPYLFNYLIRHNKKQIKDKSNQAVVPILNNKNLKEIEFSFPKDLETQNKIVAILDKAKAILDKREETIKKYDELLRALFLEMFGDPFFNTKKFPTDTLENHCSFITKGTTPKSIKIFDKPFEGSIPFLKVYHITNGEIDFHYKPSYVSDSVHNKELSRSKVKPNDVLMNIVGPPLGKIGIVPDNYKEWNINQAIVIFRAEGELLPIYLLNTLMNKNLLKSIVEQAVGVRQLNLSLKQCREIIIPIPPIAMQKEFERTYIVQKRLKEGFIKSKHKLEQLIKSISKSAFDGSMDFNKAVDLEVLLENDYQFFKENSNSSSIKLLLERLNTNELNENKFYEQQTYNKAKSFVFELIKEGKVKQVFDEKTKKVKLTI